MRGAPGGVKVLNAISGMLLTRLINKEILGLRGKDSVLEPLLSPGDLMWSSGFKSYCQANESRYTFTSFSESQN